MGDEITKLSSSITELITPFGECSPSDTAAKSELLQKSVLKDIPSAKLECDSQSKQWKLLFDSSKARQLYNNINNSYKPFGLNAEGKLTQMCWSKDFDSVDTNLDLCTSYDSYSSWKQSEHYLEGLDAVRSEKLNNLESQLDDAVDYSKQLASHCTRTSDLQHQIESNSGWSFFKDQLITLAGFGLIVPLLHKVGEALIRKAQAPYQKAFYETQAALIADIPLCNADDATYFNPKAPTSTLTINHWASRILGFGAMFMGIQLYFASRIDNVEATIKNKELPVGHEEACSVPTFKNVPYNKMYADDDESSKERFFDSLSEGDIDELSNQLENDLADPKELKKEKKPIPATNIASNIAALEKVNVVLESESEAKAKEYVTNSHYGTFATFGLGVAMMELGRADPGLKGQLAALKNLKEQVAKEKLIACNPAQQEALEAKLGLVSARESQVDAGWDGLQQYLSHGEVTQPASLFSPTIDLIHNPSNPMIMGGTSVMTARPFVVKPLPVFVPKPIF